MKSDCIEDYSSPQAVWYEEIHIHNTNVWDKLCAEVSYLGFGFVQILF